MCIRCARGHAACCPSPLCLAPTCLTAAAAHPQLPIAWSGPAEEVRKRSASVGRHMGQQSQVQQRSPGRRLEEARSGHCSAWIAGRPDDDMRVRGTQLRTAQATAIRDSCGNAAPHETSRSTACCPTPSGVSNSVPPAVLEAERAPALGPLLCGGALAMKLRPWQHQTCPCAMSSQRDSNEASARNGDGGVVALHDRRRR